MTVDEKREQTSGMIALPAPTVWPMITALGVTFLAAGLVTHAAVSFVGLILALRGAVGWFREVLPAEKHELTPVRPPAERAQTVKVSPRTTTHLRAGDTGHRVRIPAEIHPYSSGVKGGVLGGVVMAIVACVYGLIAYHSVWYPINLLAAAALPSMAHSDLEQLRSFNGVAFFVALMSHGAISILVGLLFAVLLPMFPSRRTAFWGSLTAPLIWSALVWSTLRFVNPALDARIDWTWFIVSQIAFGLVAGYVIHHSKMVETMQTWPLAARAGLEAPGFLKEKSQPKRGESQ